MGKLQGIHDIVEYQFALMAELRIFDVFDLHVVRATQEIALLVLFDNPVREFLKIFFS